MNKPTVELKKISKSFPGVRALAQVDLSFYPGEIHAIVGENGAGKSTLVKILAGDYTKDEGEIFIEGQEEHLGSPRHAQKAGIGLIHQELTLLPERSVAENIVLGREPLTGIGLVDKPGMRQVATEFLSRLGLDMDPATVVSSLPIALRQMVEIAKALSQNANVLILDEPTSSLAESETRVLLDLVKNLRDRGMVLVYISHRLEEVFEIADRISVLRDGQLIDSKLTRNTIPEEIVRMMVGRELQDMFYREASPQEEVLLDVDKLTGEGFQDVSLTLRRGEVVGMAGLVGAGRSEFARAAVGLDAAFSGSVSVKGRQIERLNPRTAVARGLIYVPEDRKLQGLFLNLSVRKNLTINALNSHSRWGFLNFGILIELAKDLIAKLSVRPSDPTRRIKNLSGGNQQKVVIAKWLTVDHSILILDEPTRGIDVGAKSEIYNLIDKLAGQGIGVVIISSELPELLGLCDRILVMRNGNLVGELSREEADSDGIMHLAAGVPSGTVS
ncbi:MAG: D-xylose ABC transporter ATP-binding protein [spirochete symbiont of Stewartia floridana]|nr:MAG: D-xylose ABC transporter ATP-binding protein [spirochete symbiont of Stewartia floridana]